MQLDLNDLESVKSFADKVNGRVKNVDILLNNAGIMALPNREVTKQGFEKQIGVNHFGHFLLTTLLLDKIKASPEGRIVNVASRAHIRGGGLNFSDLACEKNYNAFTAYSHSKLANVYFTRELASRLESDGVKNVKVVSVHPGVVRTELARYMFEGSPILSKMAMPFLIPASWLLMKSTSEGAQTSLYCCLSDFRKLENGKYHSDCQVMQETFPPQW
jgi:retinol dehydrogenase 12